MDDVSARGRKSPINFSNLDVKIIALILALWYGGGEGGGGRCGMVGLFCFVDWLVFKGFSGYY